MAHVGKDIDAVAAKAISEDTYIDNGVMGGDKKRAERLIGQVMTNEGGSGTIFQFFCRGGSKLKIIVPSGETNEEALRKMGGSVLGHKWDPVSNTFTFLPKVILGKKGRNGAYNGPQLLPENLALKETFN